MQCTVYALYAYYFCFLLYFLVVVVVGFLVDLLLIEVFTMSSIHKKLDIKRFLILVSYIKDD